MRQDKTVTQTQRMSYPKNYGSIMEEIKKASTAEVWTEETVELLLASVLNGGLQVIAEAHNAALAASVDYWQGVATQEWHKGFAAGTEQLSSEREKVAVVNATVDFYEKREIDYIKEIQQLREQLAAERELATERMNEDYTRELNAKLDQINAQSQTIRELVDALKESKTICEYDARERGQWRIVTERIVKIINAELAKVGTYPLPDGRTK